MAASRSYRPVQVFGPFYRAESPTQSAKAMGMILRSGEQWGRPGRFGGPARVKAHRGELPEGKAGYEFYTFAEPDLQAPIVLWTPREDGLVWGDDETAKLRVLITKVSQDIE
jgi:hypothetical protein